MARIRSIKPEFWTSEQVVECSMEARLLFIGLWSFADDAGIHPDSVKQLKMKIFPGDDYRSDDISRMLGELSSNALIEKYSAPTGCFIRVIGWHHQKIDKPSYKYPFITGSIPRTKDEYSQFLEEHSTTIRRGSTPGEDRRGVEGIGGDRIGEEKHIRQNENDLGEQQQQLDAIDPPPEQIPPTPPVNDVPYLEIVKLYHEMLPDLPRVAKLTETRKRNIKARWREDIKSLDSWKKYFSIVADSDFMMGKAEPSPGRTKPFLADIEFLINASNVVKIIEGKYANE
ncbi:MAG: hypothetical protein RPU15_08695 [Candidatus Sedimenticola sp. (ex Thyasira tokunagai)]